MSAKTLDEAVDAGWVIPWPNEIEVTDHPGAPGAVVYLACEPMRLADEAGLLRNLGAGDVLAASEVRASRTALVGLLHRHQVIAVPADRGVVAIARALFERCDRLEQLVADLHKSAA